MHYADSSDFPTAPSLGIATLGTTGISMPTEGQDSWRAFDDVQVRRGMLIEQGGNNHGYEFNNGIRFYDPDSNTAGYLHPWEHGTAAYVPGSRDPHDVILASQPGDYVFKNEKVYTYDNTHQMYLASDDRLVDLSGVGGVYDFASARWTHGSAPPFKTPALRMNRAGNAVLVGTEQAPGTAKTDFIDMDALARSAWGGGAQFYDGFRSYVPALDIGLWIGGGTGGAGGYVGILRRNPDYPARSTRPWLARVLLAPEAALPLGCWSRSISNGVVFDDSKLFIGGGLKRRHTAVNQDCQILDLAPCADGRLPSIVSTFADALAGYPHDYGMCQWVLDTTRNRVIRIGRRLLAWPLGANGPWEDISPAGWAYGFGDTKGFYYAPHDRIYFKGPVLNSAGAPSSTSAQANEIRYLAF
ncbi:MAG: hypothetical protein KF909_04090 [Rhodocyclaceae bacterium]|nr:hypothetical protein [Rhodocyclaceae bacterium]MCP5232284.1 hypothetical protein [Zoogloeaceae bacterium]MCB1911975.1 hypothetical protein [Rhodocyclaceae bacterium]MCP5241509.1 hypothetical protein [Zoogloeaceae bacterium]MCP5256054.1 hypothetical protein [Zoogloeaceae bacterium]